MDFNYNRYLGTVREPTSAPPELTGRIPQVDPVEMAHRALRYLEHNPLPERDWQNLFSFAPLCCPPLRPQIPDAEGKYVDAIFIGDTECRNDMAFNMMLEMTGKPGGSDAQEQVHRRLRSYLKKEGRFRGLCRHRGYSACVCDGKDYTCLWSTGMLLQSECARFRAGHADSAPFMREIFEGLLAAATRENGRAFFNVGGMFFDGTDASPEAYRGHYPMVMGPLCDYWLLTRDDRAYALLTELAEGFLYDLNPYCLHREDGGIDGHNHVQLHAIRGMAQFAYLSGNARYVSWVKAIYDFYRQWALDTGWLPEIRSDEEHDTHSETCLNADMLELELWLALSGYSNLWDRIDRAIRNYFVPCQFSVTPALERLYRRANETCDPAAVDEGLCFLREKLEGGFLSAVTPNDKIFTVAPGHSHFGSVTLDGKTVVLDMMGCCPPEGMRAVYYAWKYTAERRENGLFIHLPYTLDRTDCTVCGLPDGCRVTVRTGTPLFLRIPAFVSRDTLRLTRNGKAVPLCFGGDGNDYLTLDTAAGDTVEMTYTVPDFRQDVTVNAVGHEPKTYSYRWIGNTVVAVEPPAEYLPLYHLTDQKEGSQ